MNDNDEIMGILPTPLALALFDIGYRAASDLVFQCRAARPRPSACECEIWVSATREEIEQRAIGCLRQAVIGAPGDFEWDDLDWAAARLANEGFRTYFTEAAR